MALNFEEKRPNVPALFKLARTFLRDIRPDERVEALKCAAARYRLPYDSTSVRHVVDGLEAEWRRQTAAFEREPGQDG